MDDLEAETDKIYRSNSRFAKLRKVPRDILVQSVRKKIRDKVLQQHFETRLKIDNIDVIVLKEIPQQTPHKRKSSKRTQKRIQFRWNTPEGVTFTFKQHRY